MEIIIGIGYCMLVISIYKYIHFKYFRDSVMPFSWKKWLSNNIGDYMMLVGVSFITVQYSSEVIDVVNIVFNRLSLGWQIPHFEDNTFYWILVPVILPLILGKFAKKKIRKPISDVLKPK
jgi:NADH:ubiquinone oxidoreductase subunit 5 (subunit L)/multisubunit Na+/H+ antiporter MnhA subunit